MSQFFVNKSNRTEWIDIAKAIALFLVVFTHLPTSTAIYAWAYTVHIPLFFFVAGLVHASHRKAVSYRTFVIGEWGRLMIPYFCLGFIFWIISTLWSGYFIYDMTPLRRFALLLYGRPLEMAGVLWFLPAFFLTKISFEALYRTVRYRSTLVFTIFFCMLLSLVFYDSGLRDAFWSLDVVPLALVFFISGFIAQKAMPTFEAFSNTTLAVFVGVALFVSLCLCLLNLFFTGVPVNLANNRVGLPWLYYPASFLGIFSILSLSRLLIPSTMLRFVGEHTFTIFSLHLLFIHLILPGVKASTFFSPFPYQIIYSGLIAVAVIFTIACIDTVVRGSLKSFHTPSGPKTGT